MNSLIHPLALHAGSVPPTSGCQPAKEVWLRVRKKENSPNQSLFREFRGGEDVPLKAKRV
ncbi:hypothetical protein U0070_001784 [Myodes glareolus]|uniref:Uncharacterized protein n=1 Tax=Myodes glareolus TaxID=447135 RepID=A0AAW0HLL7_MYOGA